VTLIRRALAEVCTVPVLLVLKYCRLYRHCDGGVSVAGGGVGGHGRRGERTGSERRRRSVTYNDTMSVFRILFCSVP